MKGITDPAKIAGIIQELKEVPDNTVEVSRTGLLEILETLVCLDAKIAGKMQESNNGENTEKGWKYG